MVDFDVRQIDVDEIVVVGQRRPVNEDAVTALASSIERLGLQVPISVRSDPDFVNEEGVEGACILISGRHRVEAFRRLGYRDIAARVWRQNSDPALVEMWEISEN